MLEFMKRIGIFIICAQSLLHFSAGKDYEKYIKLLIGLMILGQFVVPIRALFLGQGEAEIWQKIERFQQDMEEATEGMALETVEEDKIAGDIYGEIKAKISDSANQEGYRIEEITVEDEEGKLVVTLTTLSENISSMKIQPIEIAINKKEDTSTSKKNNTQGYEEVITKLKKEFGINLGVDQQYIEIQME